MPRMTRSYHKNLRLLWWLRNVAIGGQTIAIAVVTRLLQIPLALEPLAAIIAALALVNIATWQRLRTARNIAEGEFFAQLVIDISALAGLLYFTGGASNPFASLFILQVVIAAITLRPFYTWAAAGLSIACYTALMVWNVEVPYFLHHHMGDFFNLHVQGMWISFILTAVIVAGLVVRMNTTIRRQDALLAEAEKIAAIGTLAANAAHELGTPLSTLLVLAEDAGGKSALITEQILRCKQILGRITQAGGVGRAEGGAAVALDGFLNAIAARWQAANPAIGFEAEVQESLPVRIVGEYGLEQAIVNLLDNAAYASPGYIRLHAAWTAAKLTVRIEDHGSGIAPGVLDAIGEAGVTTRADGMGLGLFLARSVVIRLGGMLEFSADGGTIATITLPLRKLAV
jgi:two-component system sensor histidine kinase RegB